MSSLKVLESLDRQVKAVQTQSLDLSFNELFDMYSSPDHELNIKPDYQRTFRWSIGAQSRFIETLLLEMPIPPIYVIEDEVGRYELIDGLQRISSYLHFRGVLDSPYSIPPVNHGAYLELDDCDIVKELNGVTYQDLPTTLQIRLKRAFVNVKVIRHGSDSRMKYHMFKRLNTGGVLLSEQQVRNSTIRLLSSTFVDFLAELQQQEDFRVCIENLTDERLQDFYDQELVLRFIALKNNRPGFKHDVDDFLTQYMEAVADPAVSSVFDYEREREVFRKTFAILAKTVGAQAFAFANAKNPQKLVAGFSVYHFEAFTIGLQPIVDRVDLHNTDELERIRSLIHEVKKTPEFVRITTGGGKNSPGPLNERIDFVARRLQGLYES